jgi:predicted RNA-binding protein associated with RNAse of E/G family
VLADGRPLRAVEPEAWFSDDLASVRRPWSGDALVMLVPLAGAHSVWLFWDEDGAFGNWYVNLERPHLWHANGCDTRDTLLDVVCEAPRRWRWKDEDELEIAVAVGAITREDAVGIRAEGERVVAAIERWASPFADGWERWRPDPSWPAPELPADWDA